MRQLAENGSIRSIHHANLTAIPVVATGSIRGIVVAVAQEILRPGVADASISARAIPVEVPIDV
jgi:hypothetical protein